MSEALSTHRELQPSARFKAQRPHLAVLGTSAGVPGEHALELPFDTAALLLQFRETCRDIVAKGFVLGNIWPEGVRYEVEESATEARIQQFKRLVHVLCPEITFLDPLDMKDDLNPRVAPERELKEGDVPSAPEYHAWQKLQIRRFHETRVLPFEKASMTKVGPPFEQFFDKDLPKDWNIKRRYIESGFTLAGDHRPPYLALKSELPGRIMLPAMGSAEAIEAEAAKIDHTVSKITLDYLTRLTDAITARKPMEKSPRALFMKESGAVDIPGLRQKFRDACALLQDHPLE